MGGLTFLGDEEIGDRALELLLKEPEGDRPGLMRWAASEFRRCDLGDPSTVGAHQFIADAILDNPMLGDWIRARAVYRENVLAAETFAELIDWLTPAYGDR